MTQLMEMKNGLDLITLSNLYYKTHGRSTVVAIPKEHAPNPAATLAVETSLRITTRFQDDDDAKAPHPPMESDPEQECASVTSYTTQLWSVVLALVWTVSMATWSAWTTLVMRFVAACGRVRAALEMAFLSSGGEAEIAAVQESKDDTDMMRLIRYLVDCVHAQASETDARDAVARACAQHDAAKQHVETTLALWPVVEINHETSAQAVDLYASISVVVEELAESGYGNYGGEYQVECGEPVPLEMIASGWV